MVMTGASPVVTIALDMTMQILLPTVPEVEKALAVWRQAHPALDFLLNQGNVPAKALRHFGLTLWSEGQQEAASRALVAAAALTPEEAPIWSDLAGVFYALAKVDEALACMEISLGKDPCQKHGWLLLASLHNNRQNRVEAEKAFLNALALDKNLADASFGLGLLFFEQNRFEEAVEQLQASLAIKSENPAAHACLGQAFYFLGRFPEAAAALAVAIDAHPENLKMRQRFALLRFLETLIVGDVEEAFAAYESTAGEAKEEPDQVSRTAFHLLSGYGYHEAAIKLGQARLERAPDDPVQLYLLAAVEGKKLDRAPDDYLVDYFNRFAEGFDKQLVEVLGYGVPKELHALLAAADGTFPNILDLGCGTGLAAPLLRPLCERLVGIDLAARMLEKAAERQLYHELIEAEAVAFLSREQEAFDLVFATDVLVYFGDLSALIAGAARSLHSGGLFAFSIETTKRADFILLPSGRFAHSHSYIENVSCADFVTLKSAETTVRLEATRPVAGALFILQRR